MKTLAFILLISSAYASAATLIYKPIRGSKAHCKEGLVLKTSSTVVGSKYKLGAIYINRFAIDPNEGKRVYFDNGIRITQSRFKDSPLCANMNLKYKFDCSWMSISNGVVRGRYVEHSKDDLPPSHSDPFGFTIVPIVKAYDIKIWDNRLYLRRFEGRSDFGKAVDSTYWVKMLSSPRLEKCVYERTR